MIGVNPRKKSNVEPPPPKPRKQGTVRAPLKLRKKDTVRAP